MGRKRHPASSSRPRAVRPLTTILPLAVATPRTMPSPTKFAMTRRFSASGRWRSASRSGRGRFGLRLTAPSDRHCSATARRTCISVSLSTRFWPASERARGSLGRRHRRAESFVASAAADQPASPQAGPRPRRSRLGSLARASAGHARPRGRSSARALTIGYLGDPGVASPAHVDLVDPRHDRHRHACPGAYPGVRARTAQTAVTCARSATRCHATWSTTSRRRRISGLNRPRAVVVLRVTVGSVRRWGLAGSGVAAAYPPRTGPRYRSSYTFRLPRLDLSRGRARDRWGTLGAVSSNCWVPRLR